MKNKILNTALCAALATVMVGCGDSDSSKSFLSDADNINTVPPEVSKPQAKPFSLTIAHINDHHSHLDEIFGKYNRIGFEKDGNEYAFDYGAFPRVVTKIKEIASTNDNVLKLHSGDAITGDLYFNIFEGRADAEMMNTVCFDAFALGNHEFDGGDTGLAKFLDYLNAGSCGTPVLAANVAPHKNSALLQKDYLQPYTVKEMAGEKVGIIGLDIAKKTKLSSNPDEGTEFLDETQTAQKYIDELKAQGVNKIILMTHYQYKNDLELAKNLDGVDVIVGGDSHTLLGKGFEDLGISTNVAGDYPTVLKDKSGSTVCVVQAWEYSKVVGELHVNFDENGAVSTCEGTPHLLLAQSISDEKDGKKVLSGQQDDVAKAFVATYPELSFVERDAAAQTLLDSYNVEVDQFNESIIANVPANLCNDRIPGQGRSAIVGCGADYTITNGGDMAQVVAQAFRDTIKNLDGKTPDIGFQNAGGVREDIAAGDLSLGKAYKVLPFDNTMVVLTLTGAEVKQALEDGVSNILDNDGSSGAYPYAAGLRWHVDFNKAKGERFSNLEVKRSGTDTWQPLSETENYTLVTNSFAAGGGDGYAPFEAASKDGRAYDTKTRYLQPLLDYIDLNNGVLTKPAFSEYSTQKFTPKAES